MSFPKHYVTYCVMTSEAGANPLGHSLLLLSTQDSENAPIRVIDAIGYYSQPSTTTNLFIKGLKYLIGFKVDLQGGHGVLIHEKMRELDGNGLYGLNFEATKEQFENLKSIYTENIRLENIAIKELDDSFEVDRAKAERTHKPFPYKESNSTSRYEREQERARSSGEPARLNKFHVALNITKHGLDSSDSFSCKNYALDLLLKTNIIDKETHEKIKGNAAQHAFPRFSGTRLKPLRFVSTGEPKITDLQSRRTGKFHYNRTWENKNELFWATPVHTQHSQLTQSTISLEVVKTILTRARNVEIKLIHQIAELSNVTDNKEQLEQLNKLLSNVRSIYEQYKWPHRALDKPYLQNTENTLNAALKLLTPEKINSSFILRAYKSIAMHNAILGMLGLLIASAFIITPVGASLATAALYTGHQLYGFFKEESQYSKMQAGYNAFSKDKYKGIETIDHPQNLPRTAC